MDVLKEIARLEVLMEAAKADGKVGMALWYVIRIDELKASIRVGRISEPVKTRTASWTLGCGA